jgi:small subunit ribosomal protein S16
LPAPAPMKVAPPKPDKRALFDAALKDSEGEPAVDATTPRKKAAPKKADAPEVAPAEVAQADAEPTVAEAATDEAATDEAAN